MENNIMPEENLTPNPTLPDPVQPETPSKQEAQPEEAPAQPIHPESNLNRPPVDLNKDRSAPPPQNCSPVRPNPPRNQYPNQQTQNLYHTGNDGFQTGNQPPQKNLNRPPQNVGFNPYQAPPNNGYNPNRSQNLNGYYPQPEQSVDGFSIASMVLGIVSVVSVCAFYFSIPCAIVALVLGVIATKRNRKGRGMAIAGITTSIVALALSVIVLLLFFFSAFFSEFLYYTENYYI